MKYASKILWFFLRAILLLYIPLSSYGSDIPRWDEQALAQWIEKYPTSVINGKKRSILGETNIKKILQKTVPASELKELNKYDVETPIKQVDHYLVINKCMSHNCSAELAMVVIDLKSQRLWTGFFTREEDRISTRWYGNKDDYAALPDEIKKVFLERHGD